MRAVVLHERLSDQPRKDELDVLVQAEAVSAALEKLGYKPVTVAFGLDLSRVLEELKHIQPAIVFNLVESVEGRERLLYLAPALMDAWRIPYTGARGEAAFSTTNKVMGKTLLKAGGIPTPYWISLRGTGDETGFAAGKYILKSVWEHASVGIDGQSLVEAGSLKELLALLEEREGRSGSECFAEAYIEGREFNLSILAGPEGPQVLPPAEIRFVDFPPEMPRVVGYAAKWDEESFEYRHTPRGFDFVPEDASLLARLKEIAGRCWRLFDLHGYARVDFRVDDRGNPWVLEVNANPCLSPDAGFAAALERAGIEYAEAIGRIVRDASAGIPDDNRRGKKNHVE